VFQGELDSALLAYRQALKWDPGLFDASYNYALLLDYLSDPDNAGSSDVNSDTADDREQTAADNEENSQIADSKLSQESCEAGYLAGIGASLQMERGRVKAEEDFSAGETELLQFLQRLQNEDFKPDKAQIELWTQSLVSDPGELFRRKFLRDYQRRQQQAR
jgi:hypothetical protein